MKMNFNFSSLLVFDIFTKLINKPIVCQFPVFIISYILLDGITIIQNIHGRLVNYDPAVSIGDLICRLCTIIFIAYILAGLCAWVRKLWFKMIIYLFVFLLGSTTIILNHIFNCGISPTILVLLAETTENEANEFIHTFMLSEKAINSYLIILSIAVLAILLETTFKKIFLDPLRHKILSSHQFALLLTVPCIVGGYNIFSCYNKLMKCETTETLLGWTTQGSCPKDCFNKTIASFYSLHIMNKEQKWFLRTMSSIDDKITINGNDSLNIVLVIGESYIKSHAQIYGNALHTTPFMANEQKNGRLFSFSNVISPFPSTSKTLKNVLCTNSIANHETWYEHPLFPTLFHRAGYNVYLWDNQKDMEPNTMFSFVLNSFLYSPEIIDMTYTQTNDSSYTYDEEIVTSFNSISMTGAHNLVLFHLMGQHVAFDERFPKTKQFQEFTIDSIKRTEPWMTNQKRQIIADYENATLYNDYVLNKIIQSFKTSNSIIIYFADHGEEVYDYHDSMGRTGLKGMNSNIAKYLYEIPFVIWCSDTYIQYHPETIDLISSALQRPFMIDNLCQLLFHLGNIETKYYKPELDLISSNFRPSKRLINDFFDYDTIMEKEKNVFP